MKTKIEKHNSLSIDGVDTANQMAQKYDRRSMNDNGFACSKSGTRF